MVRTFIRINLAALEIILGMSMFTCAIVALNGLRAANAGYAAGFGMAAVVLFIGLMLVQSIASDMQNAVDQQLGPRPRLWAPSLRAGLEEAGVPLEPRLSPEEEKQLAEELHIPLFE